MQRNSRASWRSCRGDLIPLCAMHCIEGEERMNIKKVQEMLINSEEISVMQFLAQRKDVKMQIMQLEEELRVHRRRKREICVHVSTFIFCMSCSSLLLLELSKSWNLERQPTTTINGSCCDYRIICNNIIIRDARKI